MSEMLPSLERLGRELERAARVHRARRRLRRPVVLLGAAAALSVSAAALAASGVLTGEPVKNPLPVPVPTPHVADGIVRQDSVALTPLRVPDPAGGPPWGLRTFTTTRDRGCVQVGRVADGKLGVLGQDGAFHDDGRFHELSPEVVAARYCSQLDGAGKLYLAISYRGLAASAWGASCVTSHVRDALRRARGPAGGPRRLPPECPATDLRIAYFGALGPQARSVTYREGGVEKTAPAVPGSGAYLVIARTDADHPASGGWVPSSSPGSGLVAVTYLDGHSCRIRSPRVLGGARDCPRVGYTQTRSSPVSSADVAASVRVRFSPRPVVPRGPGGRRVGPAQWSVHISFTVRRAAGPHTFYLVEQGFVEGTRCPVGMAHSRVMSPVARDVRVGERVDAKLYVPRACRGAIAGDVRPSQPARQQRAGHVLPGEPAALAARGPVPGEDPDPLRSPGDISEDMPEKCRPHPAAGLEPGRHSSPYGRTMSPAPAGARRAARGAEANAT